MTLPAVQHPSSGRLYAVVGASGAQLCSWDRSTKLMLEGSQKKFRSRIVSVHVNAALAGILLVHEDASVSLLAEDLKTLAQWSPASRGKTRRTVVRSMLESTHASGGADLKLLVFTGDAKQAGVSCTVLSVDDASVVAAPVHFFAAPALESTLLSAVYLDSINRLVLLWSCFTMQVITADLQEMEFARVQLSRRFCKPEGLGSVNSPVAMSSLGSSCVLIAGLAPTESDTGNLPLTVWDACYGTLQAEVSAGGPTLDKGQGPTDAAEKEQGTLLSVEYCLRRGSALIVSNRSCWTCAVQPKQASLLNSLGRLRGSAERYLADSENGVSSSSSKAAEVLLSRATTPDMASFTAELERHVDSRRDPSSSSSSKSTLYAAAIVRSAVQRCLADNYWHPLARIVRSGQVSARAVPEMVPTLMSQAQLNLLDLVLIHVHDIAESTMVQLVSYFLAPDDATMVAFSTVDKDGGSDSKRFSTDYFLCLILSRPRNDALLLRAMRTLPVAQAMALLEFCQRWLEEYFKNTSVALKKTSKAPSYAQVLDWIMLLLDAHFTSLLVIPTCRTMVQELAALIAEHRFLAEKLTPLKGVLNHYQKHAALTRQTASAKSVSPPPSPSTLRAPN